MVAIKRKAPARAARSKPQAGFVFPRGFTTQQGAQGRFAPTDKCERVLRPGLSEPACNRFADTGNGIAHLLHAMADGAADLLCALCHLVT